jgi:hypothetical protein
VCITTLNKEAVGSSETLVTSYQTTRCHILMPSAFVGLITNPHQKPPYQVKNLQIFQALGFDLETTENKTR